MAVFNKSNESRNDNFSATVLAEGTTINGVIDAVAINIYGSFEGTLKSKNTVTIAEKGYAKGEIFAKTLVVNGTVDGTANCDTIEILEKGAFNGTIISEELIIEKGGFFQGESSKKSVSKTKEAPKPSTPNATTTPTKESSTKVK